MENVRVGVRDRVDQARVMELLGGSNTPYMNSAATAEATYGFGLGFRSRFRVRVT